jgi:hypothetical protein
VDFGRPGTVIAVTSVGAPRSDTPVTHIIAD